MFIFFIDQHTKRFSLPHTSTIQSFLNRGLAKNTLTNYTSAAVTWIQFLDDLGFVPHRSRPMALWSRMSLSQQLYLIISYIIYLFENKCWSSRRISTNISGVRHFIRSHLLGLDAFNHESVTLALKATQPDARTLSVLRETRKRLPITTEMVIWFKNVSWSTGRIIDQHDFDRRMTFLGVVIGLTFLRRVSEYASDDRSHHALLSDDVHFITSHSPPQVIVSFDVKRVRLSLDKVESVRFIFRTSKSDQGGRGSYLFLNSRNADELELIHCFLYWCMISGLEKGFPFMSRVYNGRRKMLRPRMVNEALKYIADNFGFQHVRNSFTSHSLRIGGATALIASGTSRDTIQRIGGWSSAPTSSDSIYELNTPKENRNLWSALRTGAKVNMTSNDIRSIIPPPHRR